MRIQEFLIDVGPLSPDWDEQLACASCGAAILELHSKGASAGELTMDRVLWYDGRPADREQEIVCPHCGSRSPVAQPYMRDPLQTAA